MRSAVGFKRLCLGVSLLGILSIGSPFSYSREVVAGQTVAAVPPNSTVGGEQHGQTFCQDDRAPPLAGNSSGSVLGNSHL